MNLPPSTAGLILAGGASRRMGQPKALLPLGASTFLTTLVHTLSPLCDPLFIVTGFHHDAIAAAHPTLLPLLTFNPLHAQGMFTSLRHGLHLLPPHSQVLFTPVDFPAVSPSTLHQLLAVPQAPVVKPRYHGLSGHPVLLRSPAITALLAAPPTANAKDILATFPQQYVQVEDPWVARDCDTPAAYQQFLADYSASQ
jgi:molybdenum cofactor cytidylyltransferase